MNGTQDRRGVILASAAELFARKGIGATTVREIAEEVGILSGSLGHGHANALVGWTLQGNVATPG